MLILCQYVIATPYLVSVIFIGRHRFTFAPLEFLPFHLHHCYCCPINATSPTVNSPIKLIQVLQQEEATKIIPYSTVPCTTKQIRLDEWLTHLLL